MLHIVSRYGLIGPVQVILQRASQLKKDIDAKDEEGGADGVVVRSREWSRICHDAAARSWQSRRPRMGQGYLAAAVQVGRQRGRRR